MIHLIYYSPEMLETGGAETLLLRIGRKYVSDGTRAELICRNISHELKQEFINAGIQVSESEGSLETKISDFDNKDIILCVTLFEFLETEYYRQKNHLDCRNFLYVLHPNTMDPDRSLESNILKKNVIKRTVEKYAANGNILFMDGITMASAEKMLNCSFSGMSDLRFDIPLDIVPFDAENTAKKAESKNFGILSVLRAEFPFKGYVFGLIRSYTELKQTYPYVTLTLISSGDNYKELEEKVETAGGTDAGITLINGATNADLPYYYKKCSLYAGMGTTVLEAVQYGAISIVVTPYTFEFKSDHFFHEAPDLVASGENAPEATSKVREILDMKSDEFVSTAIDAYRKLEASYSIESFANRLNTRVIRSDEALFSKLYMELHFAKNRIRKLIR